MVRPNGSVIGRNSDAGELSCGRFIPSALSPRRPPIGGATITMYASSRRHTIGTLQYPNRAFQSTGGGCSAKDQRCGAGAAAAGAGNDGSLASGVPPAAAFGGFGFLGRGCLALGAGP